MRRRKEYGRFSPGRPLEVRVATLYGLVLLVWAVSAARWNRWVYAALVVAAAAMLTYDFWLDT